MWRGSVSSGILHLSVIVLLVFGLPSLPQIFDREFLQDDTGSPIEVELVTVGPEPPPRDTPTVRDESEREATADSVQGAASPVLRTPGSAAPVDDVPPPQSVSTDPDRGKDTPSSKVSIPAGALDSRAPGSSRNPRSAIRSVELQRRDGSAAPPDGRKREIAQTPPAEDRTGEEQTRKATQPGSATSETTTGADGEQEERLVTLAQEARRAVAAGVESGNAAAARSGGDMARRATPGRTEGREAQVRRDAGSAAAQPGDAGTAPPTDPGAAAREATPVADGENEFTQAISGRDREVIDNMLAADERLRGAVTPREAHIEIPEQARLRSLERLRKAADAGFANAQYNLAGKYLRGEDVPRDVATAREWVRRAAEQSYPPAQVLLGLMNFTGIGVPRDMAETTFWWSLAADRGHAAAAMGNEMIRPLLKPREVIKMRQLRSKWGRLITELAEASTGTDNLQSLNAELQAAAEQGDVAAVLALLARGADADSAGREGRNAVINAAWRGRKEIVRLFLQRGAKTESTDQDERTPLIWSAINGHPGVAAELLKGGANPNHADSNGSTALIRAAWNGHADVVRQLVAGGADLNRMNLGGHTALSLARREGHDEIVRLLRSAGVR